MGKHLYPRPWMKEARDRKNLSRSQLADLVGTTRSHIWAIEAGRRTPRHELANKIARALDVDVGNFMRISVRNEHDTHSA